jgi:hypothetical protein
LFDEGFDGGVGDVREGYVEDVVGGWLLGVEEAVEEDCVDDRFDMMVLARRYKADYEVTGCVYTFDDVFNARPICYHFQNVLWCSFGLHGGCWLMGCWAATE